MSKKLRSFLLKNDGLWSIPLSFVILIGGNLIFNKLFGEPILSLEYVEPLFFVALLMTSFNAIAYLGCNLNQRSLQKYFYSAEVKKAMQEVSPAKRVVMYLLVYFAYFLISALLFVYVSHLWFSPIG